MKNYYGKIIDGVLIMKQYSTPIQVDGVSYITDDEDLIKKAGWKKLVYVTPSPKIGYQPVDYTWAENETTITQVWEYTEIIVDTSPSLEEQVAELKEQNDILLQCILEMSEIVYA